MPRSGRQSAVLSAGNADRIGWRLVRANLGLPWHFSNTIRDLVIWGTGRAAGLHWRCSSWKSAPLRIRAFAGSHRISTNNPASVRRRLGRADWLRQIPPSSASTAGHRRRFTGNGSYLHSPLPGRNDNVPGGPGQSEIAVRCRTYAGDRTRRRISQLGATVIGHWVEGGSSNLVEKVSVGQRD